MILMHFQLFALLITTLRATASSEDPNPNGNGFNPFWPNGPYWNGPGNTPLQPQAGNDATFPPPYGAWPQNPALNAHGQQGMQMGWPSPYAYQPFPPPGFMPGPAAYFGNFAPPVPANPNPNTGPIINEENVERTETGESEPMAVDDSNANQNTAPGMAHSNPRPRLPHTNAVAGPSQPRRPTQGRPPPRLDLTQRNRGMDSASEDDEPRQKRDHGKGKKKASRQEVVDEERRAARERRERERTFMEERCREIEEEPIPREIIEIQERELRNVDTGHAGNTEAALREQITLNLDLMKRYNALEKLLRKRQLSPSGEENGEPKRMRDSRRTASNDRRQTENDFDMFLLDDEDGDDRSRQRTSRGRGRGNGGGRIRDTAYNHRNCETRDYRDGQPTSRPARLAPDMITRIPRRHTPMAQIEKIDLYLESYDERWFGHIIGDSRMTLTDRIEELSALLPTMPRPDGTFPPRMLSSQDLAEDENSEASEDPYDDKLPYTSEQKQKRYKHRLLLRQSQPGRLPTWLGRFRFPDGPYAERDNSFRGMYGPGFTYDRKNNIMYADMEAVDAAKAFAQQLDYPLPHRMGARPNPQGFPMTVREVRESIRYITTRMPKWQNVLRLLAKFQRISTSVIARYRDLAMHDVTEQFQMDPRLGNLADNLPPPVYIPLDRAYRSTGGNTGGGAGLPIPVNGTIDEWCQYAAHHFRPGGLNPPAGLTMDLSHHVSYATVWGMLLVRFLHPNDARNYYAHHLAAIAYRPGYYTDYIEQWNTE